MPLEKWEEVIIDSTNEQYALAMILKVRAYREKHRQLNVDSIAEEFASNSLNEKRDWAMRTNNIKSIVQTCKVQRRIKAKSLYREHGDW